MGLGKILLSARRFELEIQCDDDDWSHLRWTKRHFGLQCHLLILSAATCPKCFEFLPCDIHALQIDPALEYVRSGNSVMAPLCCGLWSSKTCSCCCKTASKKNERNVPHCAMKMKNECFWAKRKQCASWLEPCKCMKSMCNCTLWQQIKTRLCNKLCMRKCCAR